MADQRLLRAKGYVAEMQKWFAQFDEVLEPFVVSFLILTVSD